MIKRKSLFVQQIKYGLTKYAMPCTATETYPKFVFFTLKKIKRFYTLIKKPSTSKKNLGFHPK